MRETLVCVASYAISCMLTLASRVSVLFRKSLKTHGHSLLVKVMEIKGRSFLVADESGSMFFDVRSEHASGLAEGMHIVILNAKVALVGKCMRLSIDKWGSVQPSSDVIAGKANVEKNFSRIQYNILKE